MKEIVRSELAQSLQSPAGPTLVEALPPEYFARGHLPGAINIPHDRIEADAAELLPDRSAYIVVYCANGDCQNSAIAAQHLQRLGYTNVAVYPGGKQDWQAAGLALEGAD